MSTGASSATETAGSGNYRLAFVLVTSLFSLWWLSYGLLDVLNKH
jgi:FHS family L-fucose permease-like MFS transporter